VVGHEGEGECTGDSDAGRELFCEKIDHWNGKGSKKQRDNTEISFRFGKWIELMGQNKKKGWVKVSGFLFVIL
jgi:hypothetical protein